MSDRYHTHQGRHESVPGSALRPLASLVSVGLALRAQQLLIRGDRGWTDVLLYAVAVGLFLSGVRGWSGLVSWPLHPHQPRPPDPGYRQAQRRPLKRAGVGVIALILASGASLGFSDNHFSAMGVAAWLGAIIAFLIAAAEGSPPSGLVLQLRRRLNALRDATRMFSYEGCPVWVNTLPGDPALSTIVGALFVLAAVVVLRQFLRYGDRRGLYVLTSLLVLLIPSALSIAFPEENPSAVRAGGAMPIAALMAALATDTVTQRIRRPLPPHRGTVETLLPAILLPSAAYLAYTWYFVTYDQQYRRVAWNATEMAQRSSVVSPTKMVTWIMHITSRIIGGSIRASSPSMRATLRGGIAWRTWTSCATTRRIGSRSSVCSTLMIEIPSVPS